MSKVNSSIPRQKLNLLIADESPLYRKSVIALLKEVSTIGTILEAESMQEVVDRVSSQRVDIVLLEVRLKGGDAFEVSEYIRSNKLRTRLIGITAYTDQINLLHMAKAGIHGILLKHSVLPEELIDAIHTVYSGRRCYASRVTEVINDYISEFDDLPSLKLSEREKQLLPLLAKGFTAKEIGMRLKLETGTVEAYRKKLMNKTLTHTVQELVSFAYRNGLLTTHSEVS